MLTGEMDRTNKKSRSRMEPKEIATVFPDQEAVRAG